MYTCERCGHTGAISKPKSLYESAPDLNNFGEETHDHISEEFLQQCFHNKVQGVLNLIEKLHFDPVVPNNRNIRMRNMTQMKIEIVNEKHWKSRMRNDICYLMIRQATQKLLSKAATKKYGIDGFIKDRIVESLENLLSKKGEYTDLKKNLCALIEDYTNK